MCDAGEPKRLSRNYLRRNGWTRDFILYVLIFKIRFIAEIFSALSRLFVLLGFHLLCARLAVNSFAVYSVLGSRFNEETTRATATSTMAV